MADLEDLAGLHAEESFWRYPFGRGWSKGETESFLQRTIHRYRDPGIAVSPVVVSDTDELATRVRSGGEASTSRRYRLA